VLDVGDADDGVAGAVVDGGVAEEVGVPMTTKSLPSVQRTHALVSHRGIKDHGRVANGLYVRYLARRTWAEHPGRRACCTPLRGGGGGGGGGIFVGEELRASERTKQEIWWFAEVGSSSRRLKGCS
jgi:hypothetical protein